VDSALAQNDALSVRAFYRCGSQAETFHVELDVLRELGFGHRHAAHIVTAQGERDELCTRAHAAFDVAGETPRRSGFTPAFLRMGFEHILAGFDHILFLLALVLTGQRWRQLAGLVTAFTLAHSLTLAASVLGVLSLPGWLVEPAIALSIAYAAVENVVLRQPERRWRVAFGFGLLHGFGFAGALHEVALSRAEIVPALVLFNAGVELGQVAILAAIVPLLAALRRSPRMTPRWVGAVSLVVAAVGFGLFVERAAVAMQVGTNHRDRVTSEAAPSMP
jgi:hydrogenase/urease accessory protein HupE